MGGMPRLVVGVVFLSLLGFYLSSAGELTENAQLGAVGAIILLALVFVRMGGKKKVIRRVVKKQHSEESEEELDEDDEGDDDIPEPVSKDPLDGATLRERKMAKIAAAQSSEEDEEDEEVVPEVEVEEVHVADEFVVEVSPESIEEASIDAAISSRNERHAAIRARIEARRRSQMADIRASTAKMYDDHDQGEDLVALLSDPSHGLTILEEPQESLPGRAYGATFVRISDSHILKLRIPLDKGFERVNAEAPPSPEDLDVVIPEGMDLPPPPGHSGLAALKEEMSND